MNRLDSSILRATWLLGAIFLATAGLSCAGKKKAEAVEFLTPEETYRRAMQSLARRKLPSVIKDLGQIDFYSAENRPELEPLVRLAMADATFYQSNDLALIDARSMYLDFVTLYADHAQAPYAQFQAGICSLKQVNHPSRDQSQTHRAMLDLREVERRWPDSHYATAAAVMRAHAESNLAEHEFIVGRFYLKKKAFVAAGDRFRTILDHYPDYPEREKVYFYLARALLRSDNTAEGRIYLDKLVHDYPKGEYVDEARQALADAGGGLDLDLARKP